MPPRAQAMNTRFTRNAARHILYKAATPDLSSFSRNGLLFPLNMPSSAKTILITGCSTGGIGAALTNVLAQAGHTVFATARDPSKIPAALSSCPNVKVLTLDVVSPESVAAAAVAVKEAVGGLDVLVNNAGTGYTMPLLDVDINKAKAVHEVNLWGPLRTTQAFANLLIESKGRVVNISSVAGVINTPWIGM